MKIPLSRKQCANVIQLSLYRNKEHIAWKFRFRGSNVQMWYSFRCTEIRSTLHENSAFAEAMCECDTAFAVPQGLTRIQVIEDSADAWTQKGAAHTNHKQDGNIRTKDSYPDGANCMRICLREAIGIGDNTYVLPHNAQWKIFWWTKTISGS